MPINRETLQTLPLRIPQLGEAEPTNRQSLNAKGAFVGATLYPEGVDISNASGEQGIFLIDTGADYSVIRHSLVSKLHLKKYRDRPSRTASSQTAHTPLYKLQLSFPVLGITIPLDNVITTKGFEDGYPENVLGLIGRDVLAHCKFTYDGVNGTATLEYNDTIPLEPIF